MANIVLTSNGTLGDHRPFIGLAAALRDRGHRPSLVINPAMLPLAQASGINAVSNGWDVLDADRAMQAAASWNHLQKRPDDSESSALLVGLYLKALPLLLNACQGADLIISAPQTYPAAFAVAKRLDIPCICLVLSPLPLEETPKTPDSKVLAETANLFAALFRLLDLPPLSAVEVQRFWPPQHAVLAVSEHFYPLREALRESTTAVGFLHFEDAADRDWQPDAALENFIYAHSAPLVLTYSSLPVESATHVVDVHARAAAILGLPLIIQRGWAALDIDQLPAEIDRSRIHVVGYLPHDWLFARAAAVIHHGGIGTTACALRHGCPMLIEPHGNDQFGNARQAVALGVAAAMHPQLLSAQGIAQVLENKVLSAEFRRNAAALSALIGLEQPISAALNAIESVLFSYAKIPA